MLYDVNAVSLCSTKYSTKAVAASNIAALSTCFQCIGLLAIVLDGNIYQVCVSWSYSYPL